MELYPILLQRLSRLLQRKRCLFLESLRMQISKLASSVLCVQTRGICIPSKNNLSSSTNRQCLFALMKWNQWSSSGMRVVKDPHETSIFVSHFLTLLVIQDQKSTFSLVLTGLTIPVFTTFYPEKRSRSITFRAWVWRTLQEVILFTTRMKYMGSKQPKEKRAQRMKIMTKRLLQPAAPRNQEVRMMINLILIWMILIWTSTGVTRVLPNPRRRKRRKMSHRISVRHRTVMMTPKMTLQARRRASRRSQIHLRRKRRSQRKIQMHPKKPTSSYLFFSKDIRPKMKEKYPDASFGELNKAIGAEFKNLSQDGMKKYNDLAKKEKERYKKEMSNYVPPSSDSDNDDESDDEKPQKGGKAKKDPNAPKKNMSAYMFFSNVKRKELKKSRPDLKFGDIARAISVEYKKLSPDELKEFEDMAKADKRRYAKDMEGYTPPPKSEKTPTKKAKKDPNAPKKPMTSFMYYSTENRSRVKKENPDASFGEIAKIIGLKFRELDGEELKKYTSKASADKERYRKAMEKYEGAPKSPKASDSSNTPKKKKKAKVEVPPESESESDDSSAASDSGSGSDDSDSDSDSD
mmetsp:Transcript_18583/g.24771  ORF Transcript_18583/g.24771 Transcript_18583/m.24771 type:complete len:576 (+) Transcript_18583:239-1966(+)